MLSQILKSELLSVSLDFCKCIFVQSNVMLFSWDIYVTTTTHQISRSIAPLYFMGPMRWFVPIRHGWVETRWT